MYIYFDEDNQPDEQTAKLMYQAAEACIKNEDLDTDRISVSVSFVDMEEIHALNKQYRGVDSATDVLSFPQFDSFQYLTDWDEVSLGDVVICKEKAAEQAEEFGHSYDRELIYLFTHSILHLLGFDHEDEEDKAAMRAAEEKVMDEIGLPRK